MTRKWGLQNFMKIAWELTDWIPKSSYRTILHLQTDYTCRHEYSGSLSHTTTRTRRGRAGSLSHTMRHGRDLCLGSSRPQWRMFVTSCYF